MKILKSRQYILGILLILFKCYVFGQFERVEHDIIAGSKINNPVDIQVVENINGYIFYANNRSYYPYLLELDITNTVNLKPPYVHGFIKISPGKNTLLSLTKLNRDLNASYSYSCRFTLGVPSENVDLKQAYLLPVKVPFEFVNSGLHDNRFIRDCFKINTGDSVFSMRKGLIVATPDMFHDADRISDKKSLEILHKDGTIMTYENIDPDRVMVKTGNTVFPGQCLGLINESGVLETLLYMNAGKGVFRGLEINYCISDSNVVSFSENLNKMEYIRPVSIIIKEMTNRELKRFNSGKILF